MRKSLYTVLCLVFCATVILGGCTKQATDSPTASASSTAAATDNASANPGGTTITDNGVELTPKGTFPITKQKVTLKIFTVNDPSIEDMNTNELTKEYEAKTNVHIEWILVDAKDLDQKRNLLLASNSDMPDIFMNAKITPAQQVQFGSQGVLLPLNKLIDKDMVNVQKMFDYVPNLKKTITAPDGNIYALPSDSETYHTIFGQKLWINKTWLTKLNLKMPTTTDEYYNVLKAFKTQDPNGNGKADEIPLTGAITGYNTNVYSFLMNAFIQDQGFDQKPFILNNGKVSVAFDQPQWQEGLRYLHKLYTEGLLDPGAITQDNAQLKQLAANKDVNLLGSVTSGALTGFLGNGTPRMYEYTAVPPLKGPEGVQTVGYYPFQADLTKFAISSSSKYPDVAMRWVDWFYSQEGTMRANSGVQDRDWKYGKPGELGLNGKPASYSRILLFGKTQNVHWNQMTPLFFTAEFRNGFVAKPTDQETILYNETKNKYEPYKPKEVLPPLMMTADESEEFLGIDASMKDYILQSAAKFVVGDMDIDKDWSSYLQQLDKIGLKRYIALNQQAYDRQYKK